MRRGNLAAIEDTAANTPAPAAARYYSGGSVEHRMPPLVKWLDEFLAKHPDDDVVAISLLVTMRRVETPGGPAS